MIRSNLSTRPFYNERLATLLLWGVVAVVGVATAGNLARLASLTARQRALGAEVAEREATARSLAEQTAALRAATDRDEVARIVARAEEANDIIAQRMFSWTEFFNQIETTIPPDVMLLAVRPTRERGVNGVAMTLLGRDVEAIDTFMERLEATEAFAGILSVEEQITDDGMYRAVVRGQYMPGAALPAGPSATGGASR